ncbi:YmfQ family protein [Pseudomonas schmalbachii]|uniref:DUF2313 domain-containing protein n=1 Tax=Pseudomonas schmalbachii TaxID=2816993 RepID=A0ABS3TKE3_9PSED|nr:putative phage tail protein [Pseudomonas schmalbachii]MBO3274119.1 DUF2313 domain-containing protein [Pseudomonas schmalbachii]
MAHSADEYRNQLQQLLPPGRAIPADPGSTAYELLDGMAQELARLDARGDVLLLEVNPATTNELLPDWERVAGLPDKCSANAPSSIQARRQALLAKLRATGGQSADYYISVAAALGYTITITEFRPFEVGRSTVGEALTNADAGWVYTWRINAPGTTTLDFKVGLSTVGEALRTWGNEMLECRMSQIKPAHTILLFGYAEDEPSLPG